MSDPSSEHEDRRRREAGLLAAVRRAQMAWRAAPERERDDARRRFMDALHAFNSLVLYDEQPD
jgi:hypothetical protein